MQMFKEAEQQLQQQTGLAAGGYGWPRACLDSLFPSQHVRAASRPQPRLTTHPMLNAHRTFLASLVLATKIIQDKADSNKAGVSPVVPLAGKSDDVSVGQSIVLEIRGREGLRCKNPRGVARHTRHQDQQPAFLDVSGLG